MRGNRDAVCRVRGRIADAGDRTRERKPKRSANGGTAADAQADTSSDPRPAATTERGQIDR